MKSSHQRALMLLFLVCLGLVLRLVPLTFSGLPYNIDAFPQVAMAEGAVADGHIPTAGSDLIEYNSKMPVFSLMLSVFSIVTGMSPIDAAPFFVPLYTISAVLMVYFITLRLVRSELAAFFAAAFVSANGFFLYLTTATMKESLALVLFIFLAYAYYHRSRPLNRAISIVILLVIPFLHHLTTFVASTFIAMVLLIETVPHIKEQSFRSRSFILDLLTGPGIAILPIWYYRRVELSAMDNVSSINDITLFLSLFLLLTIAGMILALPASTDPWFFATGTGKKSALRFFDEKVLAMAIGTVILVLNHYLSIFGSVMTTDRFLLLVIPYLALIAIAVVGFNVLRYSKTPHKVLVAAGFLAPFNVILFALFKGLDPYSLVLIYRTYDYIDMSLALCIGIALAFTVRRLVKGRGVAWKRTVAVSAVFLVLICSTAPLAYDWQEVYGIESVTQRSELDAMRFSSEQIDSTIATDQRLADIMGPYFGQGTNKRAGFDMAAGRRISFAKYAFIEERWTTCGAQQDPFGNVIVSEERMSITLDSSNIYYCGGVGGERAYLLGVR